MSPDPTRFYRVNEELAHEFARLESEGTFARILELLAEGDVELYVSAARPKHGLEELIGALRPRSGVAPAGLKLPQAGHQAEGEGCAAPPTPTHVAGLRHAAQRGGWDHEGVLAVRSLFRVDLPSGPTEVYMPDHVCPSCYHDEDNTLDSCSRACALCGFTW